MTTATAIRKAPDSRRDAVINVRVPRLVRDLIDRAADATGKTRSDFILESARTHAIDVLLDQRFFALDTDKYNAFMEMLDAPPAPTEKLKQLMSRKAPWEK
jgi:uncharacterized protein (DUF1778 family)